MSTSPVATRTALARALVITSAVSARLRGRVAYEAGLAERSGRLRRRPRATELWRCTSCVATTTARRLLKALVKGEGLAREIRIEVGRRAVSEERSRHHGVQCRRAAATHDSRRPASRPESRAARSDARRIRRTDDQRSWRAACGLEYDADVPAETQASRRAHGGSADERAPRAPA